MTDVLRADGLDLPARDFIVSPGFAGVVALLAVIIASGVVLFAVRRAGKRSHLLLEQRERDLAQARDDADHAQALERTWQRWQWLVEHAAIEPAVSEGATLGVGPAVALELVQGLLRDAEELGDDTLAKTVAVYQEQLLLVLAQQGGPVAEFAGAARAKPNGSEPDGAPPAPPKPDPASVATAAAEPDDASVAQSGGGRRRR